MGAILRDAALCALVALGLCLPLIAYRMDPGRAATSSSSPAGGWWRSSARSPSASASASACSCCAGTRGGLTPSPAQATEAVGGEPDAGQKVSKIGLKLFVAVALSLPVLATLATGDLGSARYWIDLGILILTYVMLGWG